MAGSATRISALFALLVAMAAGCSRSQPEGILDKAQMAELVMDLYLQEARMKQAVIPADSSILLFTYLRQQYAAQHHIPDSLIDASFAWYLDRPKMMDEVFDRVIDSLSLKEQRLGTGAEKVEP